MGSWGTKQKSPHHALGVESPFFQVLQLVGGRTPYTPHWSLDTAGGGACTAVRVSEVYLLSTLYMYPVMRVISNIYGVRTTPAPRYAVGGTV